MRVSYVPSVLSDGAVDEQCMRMQRAVGVQTAATERGELWECATPPAQCAGPRRGVARHTVRAVAD